MKRLACLLLILPFAAFAEPVAIRSGEHDTFSRLVFSVPAGITWDVSQTGRVATVTLTGSDDGFNTSTIFERIPRTRLANVAQRSDDILDLDVSCDCHVDAFLWRPDRLVVDIVDGPKPQTETPELRAQAPAQVPQPPITELPNLLMLRQSQALPRIAETAQQPAEDIEADIAAAELALIEGLARAASQGILNPTQPEIESPPDSEMQTQVVEIEPQIEVATTVSPHPGIGISTSLDRDLALIGAVLDDAVDRHCLPSDLFEVRDWANEEAFHTQAAALIQELVGEFGQVPLDAQENLAKFYVSFGFGAEALMVLSANGVSSQSREVLKELAGLVDEKDGAFPLIATQKGCATSGALWAFLDTPYALDDASTNQVQKYFFDLPQPLRGHISARLARAFVEIGDTVSAENVLRATQNQDVETAHQTQATHALVADQVGASDVAFNVLSQEADDNARTTPASIIRLIELAIERDQPPREEDLLLAASLQQEFRDDPISNELEIALARGRSIRGQYAEALGWLSARDDEAAVAARNFAFERLSQHADAVHFLEILYGEIPDDLTSETQNTLARRLIDLGFAERASEILRGPARQEAAAERRFLRAEAAIAMRDYAAAIEALQGMTDTRARELRSVAYGGMGEHQAALSALSADDMSNDQTTLQFRAQAWERLTLEEDDVLSSFAERVLDEPIGENAETLADRRELLAQSIESREAIQNLLLRFDGVTPSDN